MCSDVGLRDPSGDFDDAAVSVKLRGGGIIHPEQSTQSGARITAWERH